MSGIGFEYPQTKKVESPPGLFSIVMAWLLSAAALVTLILYMAGVFGYGHKNGRADVAFAVFCFTLGWAGFLAVTISATIDHKRAHPRKDQA